MLDYSKMVSILLSPLARINRMGVVQSRGCHTVAQLLLSYSRKGRDFVRELNEALVAQKREG